MTDTDYYAELTDICTRLVELGFGATLDEIGRMREFHTYDAIHRALEAANDNPGARQFLANLIDKVHKDVSQSTASPQPNLFAVPRPTNWKTWPVVGALPFYRRKPELACIAHRPTLAATQRLSVTSRQAAVTFTGANAVDVPGLVIEAALAKPSGDFDWDQRITVAMSETEMLRVFALTLDQLQQARGRGLSETPRRWFRFQHQGKNIYLKVAQGETAYCVSLNPGETFKLAAMLMEQIRKHLPSGSNSDIETLVRMVVAPMARAATH
jgi:hypothetical protein